MSPIELNQAGSVNIEEVLNVIKYTIIHYHRYCNCWLQKSLVEMFDSWDQLLHCGKTGVEMLEHDVVAEELVTDRTGKHTLVSILISRIFQSS